MMNEPDRNMTEQPLDEAAVLTETDALAETPMPEVPAASAEVPEQSAPDPVTPDEPETPTVHNSVPLPMVQAQPAGSAQAWSSHDYEMITSGLRKASWRPELVSAEEEVKDPQGPVSPAVESPVPAAEEGDEALKKKEERRAAMEAYWKTALTGNPDSIPDSFRARAAADDLTSSAEDSEYDLLSAVNRSWYADHSELSREKILADWPRIRSELCDKFGAENNERELFTALSIAPEEEARQEAARKAYETAYQSALLGQEPPKPAPWNEEANPWTELQQQARENGAKQREALLPAAKTLSSLFVVYNAMEKETPWESFAEMCDMPDVVRLCHEMAEMEPQQRQSLYDLTLHEMEKDGKMPNETESLFLSLRRASHRGLANLGTGLVQFAGYLSAAAGNLWTRAGGSSGGKKFAHSAEAYLQLMEELRSVAQERVNPIHGEKESLLRTLALDVAESTPTAVIAMSGRQGMVLASASGIGSNIAEVRQRTAKGDISVQTGAGLLAFGAQLGISQLFSRFGGSAFEASLGRFLRERMTGAVGRFSLKALGAGGQLSKETLRNYAENRTGRGVDLLLQEGAARMDGVASNIDWSEYGKEFIDIELNIREAARTLPYILIGSGRASLHHFRDPHAIVSDGAALTQWGVPEETQRRLYHERDPRKQNRILYNALHQGSRWGGVGFLEDAMRSLHLLHTDDCKPFLSRDVVRDFLQLPAETEAERARVLTLGNPKDPAYIQEMTKKHAGGSEITDPKKAMPFLMMTETWTQRAYPKDLTDYPTLENLAPKSLTGIGDYSPEAERQRTQAVEKTVRYLDALTYRLLLNSTSFSTLTFSGRKPAEVGAEADAVRHKLISKVAESVMARAGGAPQTAADQIYGQFITDYYGRMRFSSAADSWIRFVPPPYLADVHTRALSERALRRGAQLRQSAHPELLKAYWVVQGIHNCVQSLVGLLANQADFRTALSRGMTPQEAYAHLLHRELGTRLKDSDWFPERMAEDVTNRPSIHAKNSQMVDLYSRMTGNFPESREGDDGRTYWRILKPDHHYTRWHDSLENCINDVSADCRVRFMPMEEEMHKALGAAYDGEGHYDAELIGTQKPHAYSYYDRLSARATGDMLRFLQEDATQAIPGALVDMYRVRTSRLTEDTTHPRMRKHPDFPYAWQIDARAVRTPLGMLRGRFDAYWRNTLGSGWLSADDAADFLQRRGVIDAARRQEIEKEGRSVINGRRGRVTPELFFSNNHHDLPKTYLNTAGMQGLLARHLADYTMGYYLAHFNEQAMPDSVREWFGLTPFRYQRPLYMNPSRRLQTGKNDAEQTEKWAHQRAADVMPKEIEQAERVRADENGEHPLAEDPLFPLLQQAIRPAASRSAEQGWAYSLGGANSLLRVRPEFWNLMQEPVRGWSLLDDSARELLHKSLKAGESVPEGAEIPMPKELENLDSVLKQYPELHRYELYPGDESRVVQMDIPRKNNIKGYRRFDNIFDRPGHEGDRIVHGGFRLQEAAELPDFFRSDERVMPALHTLSALRRAVHEFPYADARGVWWNGERYGGKDGKKLIGMNDSWYTVEPMSNIRRIFREMPEDGSSVMDFGEDISFRRREALPDDAFMSATVYRSPDFPLSQVRLMPGEREAMHPYARNPYVTHSFVGAPMYGGQLIRNDGQHAFFLTPLEEFRGDVTREMIGHMAGWWGKQSVKSALELLMERTATPRDLARSAHIELTNREVLMQLTEDTRFSASLEGRSPHELNAEEALAATWFHTLAEYETGANPEQAAKDLLRFHSYFEKRPERLKAVEDMLNDHRTWYELDPNDKWYHVVTATPEIRRANRLRREREELKWKQHMKEWLKIEDEWDRIDLHSRIGKPKTRRRE